MNDTIQRLDIEDRITFRCFPGIECFTQCCQDVNVALTPYDVLRLKSHLGIHSDEFIVKYTVVIPKGKKVIPLVLLKMDSENKRCPFVTENGCTVYINRPWSCRMYPLDVNEDGTYRIISDPSRCKGLNEKEVWEIGEYIVDQGMVPYEEMNRALSQVTIPLQAMDLDIDNPAIFKMVFMALYNLDRFREFVFQSSFFDRFKISEERIRLIQSDDVELLKFSLDWIKFGLLGQLLFPVKEKYLRKQDGREARS